MRELLDEPLSMHTTLRVGGPARSYVQTESTEEFVDLLARAREGHDRTLVIGEGSNLLVGDDGFDGLVIRPLQCARAIGSGDDPDHAIVTCEAGVVWDDMIAEAVREGLGGVEALSGIPGCIGSAVMQNIGAYGQEMGSCLRSIEAFDRATGSLVALDASELSLSYRGSMLRRSMSSAEPKASDANAGTWYPSPRWIVTSATFELRRDPIGTVSHPQLARALGVEVGAQMPIEKIRSAVLEVRASKAMLADRDGMGDHDRWSSGSFFTNPVLNEEQALSLPEDAPRYPADNGVKTSAAWLIEHAGFPRGFSLPESEGRASLSTRHTLALTNRGGALAKDIVDLARHVRDGVRQAYGIDLVPETVLVGVTL